MIAPPRFCDEAARGSKKRLFVKKFMAKHRRFCHRHPHEIAKANRFWGKYHRAKSRSKSSIVSSHWLQKIYNEKGDLCATIEITAVFAQNAPQDWTRFAQRNVRKSKKTLKEQVVVRAYRDFIRNSPSIRQKICGFHHFFRQNEQRAKFVLQILVSSGK